MARVISVHIGSPSSLDLGNRVVQTGIHKPPISGPVHVGALGLTGDAVLDTKHHGGADQAVYLYRAEDLQWWSGALGRDLPGGIFGENLVIEGLPEELRVGDRLLTEQITLELSAPRIPCSVLAAHMGDAGFVKRFIEANRSGNYARVIQQGQVEAGDPVEHAPSQGPLCSEIYAEWYRKPHDLEVLRRGLSAPLARRTRVQFEAWLAELA